MSEWDECAQVLSVGVVERCVQRARQVAEEGLRAAPGTRDKRDVLDTEAFELGLHAGMVGTLYVLRDIGALPR